MNKEELKQEIEKLGNMVNMHQEQVKDLSNDLKVANDKLADIDKPKLTKLQFEDIHCAIEQGIDEFDFDNSDNYEVTLTMYDNTVEVEGVDFSERSELTDMVVQRVESLFGVADESDDENTSTEVN